MATAQPLRLASMCIAIALIGSARAAAQSGDAATPAAPSAEPTDAATEPPGGPPAEASDAPPVASGAAPPAGEPPPPSFPGLGDEAPTRSQAPATTTYDEDESMAEPPPPDRRRPVWSLSLAMGFAGGGDDLVTAVYTDGSDETLTAGTGFSFGVGTRVTPLRFGIHSLGLGADIGIKGWSIGGPDTNFQLDLTRFPLVVSTHYAIEVANNAAVLIAGGLQHEMGINMSGSGELEGVDTDFDDSTGWMIEAGVLLGVGSLGIDLTLRYTDIAYARDDMEGELDGRSIGVFLHLSYHVITTE